MTTPPVRPRALTAQAAALAVSLMDAAGTDGTLPASEVKIGTPLEAPGDDATTHLYPFGTSGDAAATPYLLVHVLPVSCHAVRAGQGEYGEGAWRVQLDQPISAYVESGALRAFEVTDD